MLRHTHTACLLQGFSKHYKTLGLLHKFTKGKTRVKCTLVQALMLCTGRTAHRGSRGIALPFHDHGTRRGWRVSVTPPPLFTPGKDPLYRRLGGPQGRSGQVWKISAHTGIRSRDRPARSQLLYRLSYPGAAKFTKKNRKGKCFITDPALTRWKSVPIMKWTQWE